MVRKTLNADNFLLPDPASQHWIFEEGGGKRRTLAAVDWAETILRHRLDGVVPSQLRDRYEVAQAILAYAYFWHPMYAHGASEALRVAEASVALKCEDLGAPGNAVETFQDGIAWLTRTGVLSDEEVGEWDALHEMQHGAAQRTERIAYPGTWSLALLDRVAHAANRLFRRRRRPPEARASPACAGNRGARGHKSPPAGR